MPENGREINSFEVEYLETVTKKSKRWVTEIYMSTVQYDMAVVQLMCPMGAATGDYKTGEVVMGMHTCLAHTEQAQSPTAQTGNYQFIYRKLF